MDLGLRRRRALVTGGSKGLGRGCAEALAAAGVEIVLNARGTEDLEQAAEAIRGRIDWKHLLALDLADPGFDHSALCEFRGRLLRHEAGERLLTRVLDAAREGGLLKARGQQRTDSTRLLAAVRDLNRSSCWPRRCAPR